MPYDLLVYTLYTTLAGGMLAMALLMGRKMLPARVQTTGWVQTLLRDEKKMPYGLALAAAGLITFPMSQLYLGLAG
jgi:prepilin peptidase CpaA